MAYNEVIDGTKMGLNELVEEVLAGPGKVDDEPAFTLAETRALVLRAIQITRALHPESRDEITGSQPHARAARQHAVRLAIIELERGYRGVRK